MISLEETLALIRRAQGDDEEAKTKLIEANSPLVKSIIRRFKNKGLEYDDLYQLGCLGFLKAIKNFDEKFNVKFSTYVVPMVIGEIKRFMRDDGSIKVSRAIKGLNIQINRYIESYMQEHQTKPSLDEIAKQFEIDVQEVVFTMDSAKMPISIYTPLEDEDNSKSLLLIDRYQEEPASEMIDNLVLKEAIKKLEERDRKIILLRYFNDKTQSEIAEELCISQVQVSRLENKILSQIRKKMF